MKVLDKNQELEASLASFDVFRGVAPEGLQWLMKHGELIRYEPGEHLFSPDDDVQYMHVIVEGSVAVKLVQGKDLVEVAVWEPGYIAGALPFSRVKKARAYGLVIRPCVALQLDRSYFREMATVSYAMLENLVHYMLDRVRDYTGQQFQQDKLASLGKLSAGLAHELNNPASAMVRSAEELHEKIHQTPERFKAIMNMDLTDEQTDAINAMLFGHIENPPADTLSLLEREDRKDELIDWLEDHGIDPAEELAETFLEFGMEEEDLESVHGLIEEKDLPAILWWLESTLSLEKLVSEIREASGRISRLVRSIKDYSHMDRGQEKEPLDIHEGILSTLTMLRHKLKQKSISVEKEFATKAPRMVGYVGELNQVWTNLIDNAIDAMEEAGRLTIRTYQDREFLRVDITDNGSGIPEDMLNKIFDPFFTTKGVGKGTGMGLDIVQKIIQHHRGSIKVESVPGQTTFSLCFPTSEAEA